VEQLNLDGMSLAELTALDTQLGNAITARLTASPTTNPAAAVEQYSVKGRDVVLTPLKDLIELRGNVKNAIQKKTVEPDGIGIALAQINDPEAPSAGGGPYPWPFIR
jgi:hypothetical protein